MSRTTLKRRKYTIVAGWDGPFDHFFGSIETPEDKDDPWYSTLDDPDSEFGGGFSDLEEVKTRLESRVGALPAKFWEAAAVKDMNNNRLIKDEDNDH